MPHLIQGLTDVKKNCGGNLFVFEARCNVFGKSVYLMDIRGFGSKTKLLISEKGVLSRWDGILSRIFAEVQVKEIGRQLLMLEGVLPGLGIIIM
jgi:hypothetical protein